MITKSKYIYSQIFLNKSENLFIKKRSKDSNKELPIKNLLVQMPEEYFYVISFNSIISSLKNKNYLNINWINISSNYQKKGLSKFIKYFNFYGRKWKKLYLFNHGKVGLNFDISIFSYIFHYKEGYKIFKNLKSKNDVINIKLGNLIVGDLIYDTYLRYHSKPTINIKDKFLLKIIISSIYIYNKSNIFLKSNSIDYLFTSYAAYSHHGIVARLALIYKVKVISLGSYENLFNYIHQGFPYHLKNFNNYKTELDNIELKLKLKLKEKARNLLQSRINGINDPALPYMNKSPFLNYKIDSNFFTQNNKPRIVIWVHDFFDSPHVRGWLLFEDYYEWLLFILDSADTEMNDYYIKVHPNSSDLNLNVIKSLLIKFEKIRLIPKNISTKQLVDEKIDLVITNHGTVAHELPLFKVPVLCSGNNPHVSFSFSHTAKSKEEFLKIIRNPSLMPSLKKSSEIENEIYNFYLIHYLYNKKYYLSEKNKLFISYLRSIENKNDFKKFIKKLDTNDFKFQFNEIFNIKNFEFYDE
jgi:hypothetical protein